MTDHNLPPILVEIADDFRAVPVPARLQMLLEFSQELPELPEFYREHPDLFERVEECQAEVWIFVEVGTDSVVTIYATAPEVAPTTRGFASILIQGLSGLPTAEVLAVPSDFVMEMGLKEAISPLRLRGMVGMLERIKRQVREKSAP